MLFDDSTRVWCDEMGVVQVVKERGYGADVRFGVERGTGEGERGRSKSILELLFSIQQFSETLISSKGLIDRVREHRTIRKPSSPLNPARRLLERSKEHRSVPR
jgi:hypothetical protein